MKALQNEVFFYIPFAVLLARLRDIRWSREQLIRCLLVTVGLAVAFSLIGYVEEATGHLIISSKLVLSNSLHEYFTVNSVFFDPNIFGRYLTLVMLLAATVLLYDRRTRVQLGSILVLAILWTCLVFTLSRSSLVALALGLAVLAAFRWKTRPVIYLGVVVVILGAVVFAVDPSKFGAGELQPSEQRTRQPDHKRRQAVPRRARFTASDRARSRPSTSRSSGRRRVPSRTRTTFRSPSPRSRASSANSCTWHWSSRHSWLCSGARAATPTASA